MDVKICITGKANSGKDTVADYLVRNHGFTKIAFAGPVKRIGEFLFGLSPRQCNDAVIKESAVGASHRWPFTSVDHLLDLIPEVVAMAFDLMLDDVRRDSDSYSRTMSRYPFESPREIIPKVRVCTINHIVPLFTTDGKTIDPVKAGTITPRVLLQRIGTEMFRTHYVRTWIEAWLREAGRVERAVASDCRFLNEAEAARSVGAMVWKVVSKRGGSKVSAAHSSEVELDQIQPDLTILNDGSFSDLYLRAAVALASRLRIAA